MTNATTIPQHDPQVSYVLLKVRSRFPIPGGAAEECARRLWSHDSVVRVDALADGPTLSDVISKIEGLP